jgi:hypothetical protein
LRPNWVKLELFWWHYCSYHTKLGISLASPAGPCQSTRSVLMIACWDPGLKFPLFVTKRQSNGSWLLDLWSKPGSEPTAFVCRQNTKSPGLAPLARCCAQKDSRLTIPDYSIISVILGCHFEPFRHNSWLIFGQLVMKSHEFLSCFLHSSIACLFRVCHPIPFPNFWPGLFSHLASFLAQCNWWINFLSLWDSAAPAWSPVV